MDFDAAALTSLFAAIATRMAAERDALCALDGAIGDGDHGIAMEQGFAAAARAVDGQSAPLQDLFTLAAKALLNEVGASSGPLYATALLRAGKAAGPRDRLPAAEVALLIVAMRDGIIQRGKAEPGQKTMLDAWHPSALAASSGASAAEIAAAAAAGAEATRDMRAALGRAARLGDRSLGHPDPGAVSAAMIVAEICRFVAP